jgi:hypothetical protein
MESKQTFLKSTPFSLANAAVPNQGLLPLTPCRSLLAPLRLHLTQLLRSP